MPEGETHKNLKRQAAGQTGENEVPVKGGKGRLDAGTEKTATEIERSGDPERIGWSLDKLEASRKKNKKLMVPAKDVPKAKTLAGQKNINVLITDLQGGNRVKVRKRRKR
ncbi:MAG: hypothetical protein M1598_04575 [Actinobacteria bacterium]|nr:hypothetical protein [Actinomycetota bacterium]